MIKLENNTYKYTNEEILDVINLYNKNNNISNISKKYNVSRGVIERILRANNIEIKKKQNSYYVDENYFENIDTEEKAYWLGFIWSDGYLCERKRNKNCKMYTSYEFKLSLMQNDYTHLNKFIKDINSNFKVKFYKNNSTSFSNGSIECRLMIYNKNFCKILKDKYNLVPHRNNINNFIQNIPFYLQKHFIRGILDADGSFNYYYDKNDKKCAITFNCCENVCNFINKYFIKIGLMKNTIKLHKRHKNRDENCFALCISGNVQADKILDYLYENSNIYLDRKYDKYLKKWN